jgi:hypothetical protein
VGEHDEVKRHVEDGVDVSYFVFLGVESSSRRDVYEARPTIGVYDGGLCIVIAIS